MRRSDTQVRGAASAQGALGRAVRRAHAEGRLEAPRRPARVAPGGAPRQRAQIGAHRLDAVLPGALYGGGQVVAIRGGDLVENERYYKPQQPAKTAGV